MLGHLQHPHDPSPQNVFSTLPIKYLIHVPFILKLPHVVSALPSFYLFFCALFLFRLQINHFTWRFPGGMPTFYWRHVTLKGSTWSLYGLWLGILFMWQDTWNGFPKRTGKRSLETRKGWHPQSPSAQVGETWAPKRDLNPSQLNVLSLHSSHTSGPLKQPVGPCGNCVIPFCWACGLRRLRALLLMPHLMGRGGIQSCCSDF